MLKTLEKTQGPSVYHFPDFTMNIVPEHRVMTIRYETVSVSSRCTPTGLALLTCLLSRHRDGDASTLCVPIQEILCALGWDEHTKVPRIFYKHMSQLRARVRSYFTIVSIRESNLLKGYYIEQAQ